MKRHRIAHLESELCFAREAYRYWARQECELTSDERSQKSLAQREVDRLEKALLAESRTTFQADPIETRRKCVGCQQNLGAQNPGDTCDLCKHS